MANTADQLIPSCLFCISSLQVLQARLLKVSRGAGAPHPADGGLGHHGGVCGLQEVHHRHYRLQQAQPVAGHQEGAPQTQDPVLLPGLAQREGGLPALRAHHQGDLTPAASRPRPRAVGVASHFGEEAGGSLLRFANLSLSLRDDTGSETLPSGAQRCGPTQLTVRSTSTRQKHRFSCTVFMAR